MSTADEHAQFRELIDEVIVDELPASDWARLREHLHTCLPCRARYDKAVLAERMLHGGPQAALTPSPAEFDRIAEAVLAPIAQAQPAWQRMLQWFAPTQRWATGLVAVAALFALVPILKHNHAAPTLPALPGDGMQARGGKGPVELFSGHPQLKGTERLAGLRAFCLDGSEVHPLEPKGPALPACARSGELKLAVSNPGKFARVFLVGMDGSHALKWYAPRPPATESVLAPAGGEAVDAPVGATVRLAVNHQTGPVRIYALFSDRPVKASEVEAASRELARRGVRTEDAASLPIPRPDVLQRSLLIDVQP